VNEIATIDRNAHCVPIWGSTIYHLEDLPFTIGVKVPYNMKVWNDQVANLKVRPLVPTPEKGSLPLPKGLSTNFFEYSKFLPDLRKHFGFNEEEAATEADPRCRWEFKGGENVALKRL